MRRVDLLLIFTLVALVLLAQAADLPGLPLGTMEFSRLVAGLGASEEGDGAYGCSGCPVILISIDTLRGDHLGAYGYPLPTSPNIDRFAADAVVFLTTIAPAASTLRSHASMFTSLFWSQHGSQVIGRRALSEDAVTVAEVLHANGYGTVAFTSGAQTAEIWGLGQGFDLYDVKEPERKFDAVVDDALLWLDTAPSDKFFLFLHTYEVHAPYTPSQRHLDLLGGTVVDDRPASVSLDAIERLNRIASAGGGLGDGDVAHVVRAYDAEIRSVDEAFGDLIAQLQERDLYDRALIVVTSDHGEEFGEHGAVGWHSHSLYDELLRVPLIVKFPRSRFAGRSAATQVRLIDIAPTLVEVAGIAPPPTFEGLSLIEALKGARPEVRWSLSEKQTRRRSVAIRTDRWKLYDGRLYDLVADPLETRDVGDRHPGVRAAMEMNLARLLALPELGEAGSVAPEGDVLEQLRALGYIR